jgi:enamine deaminase RidA (YjgF/YER057c/UK114 family)
VISHKAVTPPGWKAASGYANGVTGSGRVIVTAGQIGWNPSTNVFESDDFVEQTAQALRNVMAILETASGRAEHLVRLTWYITDRAEYMRSRRAIGEAYKQIVGRHYPAMSVVVVKGLLEERAKVEIEATAVVPG